MYIFSDSEVNGQKHTINYEYRKTQKPMKNMQTGHEGHL